jgi:hypothetical protein
MRGDFAPLGRRRDGVKPVGEEDRCALRAFQAESSSFPRGRKMASVRGGDFGMTKKVRPATIRISEPCPPAKTTKIEAGGLDTDDSDGRHRENRSAGRLKLAVTVEEPPIDSGQ